MAGSGTPTTVTVQLPTKWMAVYFAEWIIKAFIKDMLENENQRLTTEDTNSALRVVFIRNNRQED